MKLLNDNEKSVENSKNFQKIGISSTGKDLESEVDAKFGRCPYFLIVEIKDKEIIEVKAIENAAAGQAGGAGITAAQIVANEKVEAVITVNMGPRALDVFQQLGIDIYQGSGKIKDIVGQFIEGKLTKISAPTGPRFMGRPETGADKGRSTGQGMGQGGGRRF